MPYIKKVRILYKSNDHIGPIGKYDILTKGFVQANYIPSIPTTTTTTTTQPPTTTTTTQPPTTTTTTQPPTTTTTTQPPTTTTTTQPPTTTTTLPPIPNSFSESYLISGIFTYTLPVLTNGNIWELTCTVLGGGGGGKGGRYLNSNSPSYKGLGGIAGFNADDQLFTDTFPGGTILTITVGAGGSGSAAAPVISFTGSGDGADGGQSSLSGDSKSFIGPGGGGALYEVGNYGMMAYNPAWIFGEIGGTSPGNGGSGGDGGTTNGLGYATTLAVDGSPGKTGSVSFTATQVPAPPFSKQYSTSGSFTDILPLLPSSYVWRVIGTVLGGGGGGKGGRYVDDNTGIISGGYAGEFSIPKTFQYDFSGGTTLTSIVGAGGLGGNVAPTINDESGDGTAGGQSSFSGSGQSLISLGGAGAINKTDNYGGQFGGSDAGNGGTGGDGGILSQDKTIILLEAQAGFPGVDGLVSFTATPFP